VKTAHDYLQECIAEAKRSRDEGGIPIGAILVSGDGDVIARGRNRRVQDGNVIQHAEMNCLQNAGPLSAEAYRDATLYTTLSPCFMCGGAALLFGIRHIVAGENRTVAMGEQFLQDHGVRLDVLGSEECYSMLQDYIAQNPAMWNADKGEH
jgi:cytosine/creatinine deaminase